MVQLPCTQSAPQDGAAPSRRLIRLHEVLHRTGLSRSTVYRRMELGQFPKPYPLGGRIVAWAESEIDRWIAEKLGGYTPTRIERSYYAKSDNGCPHFKK